MTSEFIGDLHFENEYPTDATVDKRFDQLDFQRGCQAFLRNITLLTPNSETVYGITYLDLNADGPTVCEVAPGMLGLVDDMWMREVTNVGPAGHDQGRGGRFLFVPPGYEGELPPYGFHIARPRTCGVWFVLRGMRTPHGSSAEAVALQRQTRIYPLAQIDDPRETRFVNASGKNLDTIHPIDLRFFEDLAAAAP